MVIETGEKKFSPVFSYQICFTDRACYLMKHQGAVMTFGETFDVCTT